MPSMNAHFDKARDVVAHEKHRQDAFELRQDEIRIETGQVNPENVGRITRVSRTAKQSQQAKAKQSSDNIMFIALLDQMRRQLEQLEQQMAAQYKRLQAKYGDDAIDGMAKAFLFDGVYDSLKTDEDKLKALADKFLNSDGTIKDKYKDLEEAKYVRDWQITQKLKPLVEKYNNHTSFTAEEKLEILATAEEAGIVENTSAILQSTSQALKETLSTHLDNDRAVEEVFISKSGLTFGGQ